jgi:uncharacterized Ntn-hydrolase superfamily protein
MMSLNRLAVGLVLCAAAATAQATWSIVLIDTRTGEIGIASATCLSNFDLQANSPVVVVGRGAAAAQSSVDVGGANRTLIRNRLLAGVSPQAILAELALTDGNHESRQYGIADVPGRAITFTGGEAGTWGGGVTGSFAYTYAGQASTIVYAIQGNILTGEPVVAAALDAIVNTNIDLPGRLMAGMEAARAMGGDGRCSCINGSATSCGAPPASFVRTANCGYLIVSRTGDSDLGAIPLATSCNTAPAAADLNGDGLSELIVPDSSLAAATSFRVFANTAPIGTVMPAFDAGTSYPCVVSPVVVATGDFTGDGRADVVVGGGSTVSGAAGALTLYRARADGGLEARTDIATPRRVLGAAIADVDGRLGADLIYSTTSQLFVALNTGGGALAAPVVLGNYTNGAGLVVTDVTGDGFVDIIIGAGFAGIRGLSGRGDGTFAPMTTVPLAATSRGVVVHDFNGDGRKDMAALVALSSNSIVMAMNTATGFTTTTSYSLGSVGSSLCLADVDRDGRQDLACIDSQFRVVTLFANATGGFAVTQRIAAGAAAGAMLLSDLNSDGLPEAVASTGPTLVLGNSRGTLINPAGFAAGKYFMDINIANQSATAVDPVFQMQDAFNAIRTSLLGVPDATRSRVTLSTGTTNPAPGKRMQMVVELRDYRGIASTGPLQSLVVTRQGPGPFATTHSAPVSLGNGRFRIDVTTVAPGTDRYLIVANDGNGPVTLMPSPVVTVVRAGASAEAP